MPKDLQGTETEKNLKEAFVAEATSLVKYRLFSDKSDYKYIENIFLEIASQEEEHAEVFLKLLEGIGDDLQNLRNSVALEGYVSMVDYPDAARIADEEGFHDIAKKFREIASIEARHKKTFEEFTRKMQANMMLKSQRPQKWMCLHCGFIYEGTTPPDECPVCEHPREDFRLYKEE